MKKTVFILNFVALFSTGLASARADAFPIYGDWVTSEATATLYMEDRTVSYVNCTLRFRFFATDASESQVRIENLSGKCTNPKYWDLNLLLPAGILDLGTRSPDGFTAKLDVDGTADFLEVRRANDGITLDWSERSFDGVNFDLSTGAMKSARFR